MSDWQFINKHRIRNGPYASDETFGWNGAAEFRLPTGSASYRTIFSDGEGWQHVSVSICGSQASPSWNTMCAIKDLFWEPEDAVIQIHPPKSEYVNFHPGCLHLWRCIDGREQPLPNYQLVGPKS